MELDLQGNISKFTLPEIFQLIAAGRKSGTLGIQKDDSIVMIYFENGDITYGYGPRQTFHLGQLLKDRRKISAAQLEEAIQAQARTENTKRLGEILIAKGFIDRADLEAVIKDQVEFLLFSLLAWQEGSFKFYENQFPTEEEITVRLSVENVILEGLRRMDEMNLINEVLPDRDAIYTISASQGGRTRAVTLQAGEWNVMAMVDGHRSINELARTSPLGVEETLKRLALLKLAGIITQTERKPTASTKNIPTPELENMVNRLAGLFEEYLHQKSSSRLTTTRNITTTTIGDQVESR
ncbi:MAG: DUF4388 domain-containing protein [candidate division Zixibacteria bacterium]|nr:DUF4388 domain-containing protein [candidate division Zixibacteria bacterium]